MKWDNCILFYQKNMFSENRQYMTSFKVRIDCQNMQWKYNMLKDQKETLLKDSSMTSWIRLFICGFYRNGQCMGTPVFGPILTMKAKILYEKLYGSGNSSVTDTSDTSENSEGKCFKASSGWLTKFKPRHGIHKLSCEGESLSASLDDVDPFKIRLSNIIEEGGYAVHQLFNCDETGLNWKMLQDTTLANGSERSARGFKVSEMRVTLLATDNTSGNIRLPLVVIYKCINLQALKHCNLEILLIDYYGQEKLGWIALSLKIGLKQGLYQGLSTI